MRIHPSRRHVRSHVLAVTIALVTLAPPGPVARAATPSITLKSYCGPIGTPLSITVVGQGFGSGSYVVIFFDEKDVGDTHANANGAFTVTVPVSGQPRGEHTVRATHLVPGLGPPGPGGTPTVSPDPIRVAHANASVPFGVPCPSVTIDPICGPAGVVHNVLVQGSNFLSSLQTATIAFGANNFPAAVKPDRTFAMTIPSPARPNGQYPVSASQSNSAGVAVEAPPVQYTVPCPISTIPTPPPGEKTPPPPGPTYNPVLRFEPPVGQTGRLTVAVGSGFPPDSPVTITFTGFPASWAVAADGAGNFRRSILILPHESLGPRTGVAQTPGQPPGSAPYLVVAAPAQPSGFPFSQLVARR